MCDGLAAGAGAVDVGAGVEVEDCEGGAGEAFGGDIDVFASERGGGGEEEGLLDCPCTLFCGIWVRKSPWLRAFPGVGD